jgi:SNF family Na+-dependent transporter
VYDIFFDFSFFTFFNTIEIFDNLRNIGILLYVKYCVYFLLAGIALLVAMFGAIALTLKYEKNSKEQKSFKQLSKNVSSSAFLINLRN